MAPSTRAIYRPSTPPNQTGPIEADTIKRTKFYDLWDAKPREQSRRSFCTKNGYNECTARKWLNQRMELGSPAYRRTRPRSKILGRTSKIQKKQVQLLLSPSRNPHRIERFEVMIEHFNLGVKPQQLRRRLLALSNKARRYKAAYYKDELDPKTEKARENYGNRHKGKSVQDFWQWVYFTDEFHLDITSEPDPLILREAGTRYHQENVVARPPKQGVTKHLAGWVN